MRLHSNEMGTVLAAADAELLGKKLKQGKIALEVRTSFYLETHVTPEELGEALDEATNANLVGERVIAIAREKGLLGKGNPLTIEGVPHAQIYKL